MNNKDVRLLYLTTVPWGWIKQRPHFIAEKMSNYHSVDVFCKVPLKLSQKDLLTEIPHDNRQLTINHFFIFPFERIPVLKHLNLNFINRLFLWYYIKKTKKYDVIWFASPILYSFMKNRILKTQTVVYDCMDDMAEFGNNAENSKERQLILKTERDLLTRADVVFCSAEYLKTKILSRAGLINKKATVVNNAIEMPQDDKELEIPPHVSIILETSKSYNNNLLYIGTISEWFDFESVLYALDKDSKLHVTLIGPSQVMIPKHPRLFHLGTVERKYLFEFMKYAKALIMPFVVNELIRSVNPVKLYEYVYSGKPVVASRYGETEKFSDFVQLYSNKQEFFDIISNLDNIPTDETYKSKCKAFVSMNTWDERCKNMNMELMSVLNSKS